MNRAKREKEERGETILIMLQAYENIVGMDYGLHCDTADRILCIHTLVSRLSFPSSFLFF